MSAQRNRNYCFTLNNYTDEEVKLLKEAGEMNKYVFICWGYETAEDITNEDGTIKEGTPHLQGYVECKSGRTLSALKKDPGFGRMHLEPRAEKSTKLLAVTYCAKLLIEDEYMAEAINKLVSKEEKRAERNNEQPRTIKIVTYSEKQKFIEDSLASGMSKDDIAFHTMIMLEKPSEKTILDYGRFNLEWRKKINNAYQNKYFEAGNWQHGLKPGTRTDINVARDIVNTGGGMREVLEHVNSYQGARMAQLLLTHMEPTRNWKTKCYWFWGPTGKGKSEMAWELCKEDKAFPWVNSNSLQWFDGYDRHTHVILDDFRGNQSTFSWILRLTDKYPLKVPIKGGFADWCPKVMFITAPDKPEICYEGQEDEKLDQLIRRIDEVIEFK